MYSRLTVGTRGSLLARTQTQWVMDRLAAANPGLELRMEVISTAGDRLKGPLPEVGGKGLFTEELERALLDGSIDLAVHSCKDLPTRLADGLAILAYPPREDPRDAWVSADGRPFTELPTGSTVGTTSLRRQAQLLALRNDLTFVGLRGNVDTRIRKVRQGQCAAAVLAMSGLIRAGLVEEVAHPFEPSVMLPAAGQGALAVEGRRDDEPARALLGAIHHGPTATAVDCERAVLAGLNAGCRAPLAVLAVVEGESLTCEALVIEPTGRRQVRARAAGAVEQAGRVVEEVIGQLSAGGAADIIAACRAV
ncbi:MAG: hydroxymethylbilane synthase [Phycisphaerae bacterium]|jgi:hydroxymethylbilane synthase